LFLLSISWGFVRDDDYRQRIAFSPEAKSVAGPINSYLWYAKSASIDVKDVDFHSPLPNDVILTLLSEQDDGIPNETLLETVLKAVNPDDVRAQGDRVTVEAAQIIHYQITATILINRGPDPLLVVAQAQAEIERYTVKQHHLGGRVVKSGVDHALHQAGAVEVILSNFTAIHAMSTQAPFCTAITLSHEVIDE
jgi:phage-related baseplate assembly protein